jgi:enoyl-CoA hydratase
LIITGAGAKAFVAGADIARMSTMTRREAAAFASRGHRLFRRIEALPIPVIAAINGYALGGGCELALACDLRIAADNAVFGQPEVSLGITPGFGGTQRLARLIGIGPAKELLFTGRRITASEALRVGLVSAVYPADELMAEAGQLAETIANNAPIAVRAVKKSMDIGLRAGFDAGLEAEAELHASCYESNDQRGAMRAFVNKSGPYSFRDQ